MAFEEGGKYEADNGRIYSIKLEATRYAAAGTPPTAAIDMPQSVEVSASKRQGGLRPRGVRLARTLGTAPDTFKKYTFLPVLGASAWNVTPFIKGGTVTIDGTAWTVIATVPENGV